MICSICKKEIGNKEDCVMMKSKGIVGIEDDKIVVVCKSCIEEKILKPHGFKDFSDYLKRYWGV
jgi:hypothetical protein